jgi:hypothetical protein
MTPVASLAKDPAQGGPTVMRLLGQSHAEAEAPFKTWFAGEYRRVLERYHAALCRVLPGSRRKMSAGACSFWSAPSPTRSPSASWSSSSRRGDRSGGRHQIVERLLPFVVAGFRAPPGNVRARVLPRPRAGRQSIHRNARSKSWPTPAKRPMRAPPTWWTARGRPSSRPAGDRDPFTASDLAVAAGRAAAGAPADFARGARRGHPRLRDAQPRRAEHRPDRGAAARLRQQGPGLHRHAQLRLGDAGARFRRPQHLAGPRRPGAGRRHRGHEPRAGPVQRRHGQLAGGPGARQGAARQGAASHAPEAEAFRAGDRADQGAHGPGRRPQHGPDLRVIADRFGITRKEMDRFAAREPPAPLPPSTRAAWTRSSRCTTRRAGPRGRRRPAPRQHPEKLATLKPFFDRRVGQVTAGNSSQITDGAAVLLLASEAAVKKHKLEVLGVIEDCEWAALDPAEMGLGPAHASAPLLQRHGLGSTISITGRSTRPLRARCSPASRRSRTRTTAANSSASRAGRADRRSPAEPRWRRDRDRPPGGRQRRAHRAACTEGAGAPGRRHGRRNPLYRWRPGRRHAAEAQAGVAP